MSMASTAGSAESVRPVVAATAGRGRAVTRGERRDADVPADDAWSDGWQIQGGQAFAISEDVDLDDQPVDHGETHDGPHPTVHDGQEAS